MFSGLGPSDDVERAEWRNIGSLYAEIWEDLSYRWNTSEAVQQVFGPWRVDRIPTTGAQWQATTAPPGEATFALPNEDFWIPGGTFLPEVLGTEDASAAYRYVRYHQEDGLPSSPQYALLSGRFAKRMVFDEEPRRYDLMDADPSSSAPFFQQLYPYKTARQVGAPDLRDELLTIPLSRFEVPGDLRTEPRLASFITGDVGVSDDLMLEDTQVRALEERITRSRIRREGFSSLSYTPDEGMARVREIASREYESFYRDIGAQVVKFGRDNYTPTHIRVLTSLFAIQSPPGSNRSFVDGLGEDPDGLGAVLVDYAADEAALEEAAAEPEPMEEVPDPLAVGDEDFYYEEDAPEVEQTDAERQIYDEGGAETEQSWMRINYAALPPRIVRAHLEHLSPLQEMDVGFSEYLHNTFGEDAERRALLKDKARAMEPLDDESILGWIARYAARYAKGANERGIEDLMGRVALKRIVRDARVARLAAGDLLETDLLLDHVRHAFVARFDDSLEANEWPTPVELEDQSLAEWLDVLGQHDYFPVPLDDDAAARDPWYDPLSVCTQSADVDEAAEERVFGAVNVDLLLVAADHLPTDAPLDALWMAREKLPFLMMDDPREGSQVPEMTRLVGLPDNQAVYRMRWRVWTGWHVFWTTESLGSVAWHGEVPPTLADAHLSWMRRHYEWLGEWARTPVVAENAHRVALRTGAVCSDLVLADPEIVPTLVRASLLDDAFRPTYPYTKGRSGGPSVREQDAAFGIREVGNRNVSTRDEVAGAADVGSEVAQENSLEAYSDILPDRNSDENIGYIRDLVVPELSLLSGEPDTTPSMLFVFDSKDARTSEGTRQMRPRTPYFRYQRQGGRDSHVRTAAWSLALPPSGAGEPRMLSPDWVDTNSVNAQEMNPRWRQRRTAHFTIFGDLGLRPVHLVQARCASLTGYDPGRPDVASTTAPCDPPPPQVSSGLSATYGAVQTLWLASNRQIAAEIGFLATGTLTFRPIKFLYPNQPTYQATRYYISGGPVVGIRGASRPRPLYRSGGSGALWGAKDRDESTRTGRFQYGLRAGLEFGPSFNGLETQGLVDSWAAWSFGSSRAKNRMFTAYHPSFLLGPYVQAGYSRTIARAVDERQVLLDLGWSASLNVGIRVQGRLFKYGGADPAAVATGAL